jgi:transposase-like protein
LLLASSMPWRQAGDAGADGTVRLRAENARLKMHVDILKKATAYFAKDAL